MQYDPQMEKQPLKPGFPAFVTVMMIISLVLCSWRLRVTYGEVHDIEAVMAVIPPGYTYVVWLEVTAGIAIVFTGLIGNCLILMNYRVGAYLSFASIAFAVMRIGVSIFIFTLLMHQMTRSQHVLAETFRHGAVLVTVVQAAYLLVYAVAIIKFLCWKNAVTEFDSTQQFETRFAPVTFDTE